MLLELKIENFALIDKAQISFDKGFTVITGETGSGKSILLNALNLLLGERADFSVIGSDKETAIVEGVIQLSSFKLEEFFKANELDYFPETIIRRVIYKQGRSRAFINDVPVGLSVLKDLSSRLIHIHSQYNTLELKDPNYQLEVLDILAETTDLRINYLQKFERYNQLKRDIESNKKLLQEQASLEDYNSFQLNELKEANLNAFDFDAMKLELSGFENAEEIQLVLGEITDGLNNDNGVLSILNLLKSTLNKKKSLLPDFEELHNRIESTLVELKDISEEAEDKLQSISSDPERQELLHNQLDLFNRLLFKHKKQDQSELLALMQELEGFAVNNDELKVKIDALETELKQIIIELNNDAIELHQKRAKAVGGIENRIQESLDELKLKDTEIKFVLSKKEEFGRNGITDLNILFSPNKGVAPVPIHQAASGGELSRVMLALQNLISEKMQLQTILFDEIDTGVSGDVAGKMAGMLKKMGENMQVIAITHLPQVAAKGNKHLKVSKSVQSDRTLSKVEVLDPSERVQEIASLMSGEVINQAALDNAKALMA